MNKTFSPVLAARMAHYNANPEADSKVKKVRGEIEEVRQVMVENIEAILERGDKIELLVDKSGDLSEQASKFKKSSIQLKRNMWWQQCRLQVLCHPLHALFLHLLPAVYANSRGNPSSLAGHHFWVCHGPYPDHRHGRHQVLWTLLIMFS
jgi:hypothetical protein